MHVTGSERSERLREPAWKGTYVSTPTYSSQFERSQRLSTLDRNNYMMLPQDISLDEIVQPSKEKLDRVPHPSHRHAAPSAPWPWIDLDDGWFSCPE